jgi:G:T-mismatch repair DNA endonuclease (very short patch repair protein)
MKDIMIELIKLKPKHYTRLVKKDKALFEWVKSNSKINSNSIPEMVYSALHGVTNTCKYGNRKNFVNISQGFVGCGPAAKCACTKENIAKSVTKTKAEYSEEKRAEINSKRDQTMIARFGVAYNSQREDIHHIWKRPKIDAVTFQKLNDKEWLDKEYNTNKRTAVDIAQELDVYYSTVIDYCIKHGFTIRQRTNYSLIELDICRFIDELGINYEQGDWKTIGKELDIYIPSHNLAIEVDGLYWHSYHPSSNKVEDKTRHIDKTKLARENGIDLMHVTDFEWTNKTDIIKSMIMSKLGLNQRIFARSCTVDTVQLRDERAFLNRYHIQGYIHSQMSLGLYYQGELISLMSVGKSRFAGTSKYELLRYCTKSGITVVGGGSKLISRIKQTHGDLMTYCDLSKGSGDSYLAMGFNKIRDTKPGYFWTDGNMVISRFKAQRSQLKKWLKSYDPKLSESENMFAAKYRRFHDCGNRVFILT